jgi:hypothetical protein
MQRLRSVSVFDAAGPLSPLHSTPLLDVVGYVSMQTVTMSPSTPNGVPRRVRVRVRVRVRPRGVSGPAQISTVSHQRVNE